MRTGRGRQTSVCPLFSMVILFCPFRRKNVPLCPKQEELSKDGKRIGFL